MFISSVWYNEFVGSDKFWQLEEFNAFDFNLVVGKNSSGKSRTMSIINAVALLISGKQKAVYTDGHFKIKFQSKNGEIFYYEIQIKNKNVVLENLKSDKNIFISRTQSEKKILTYPANQFMDTDPPSDELLITRRDGLMYPYLQDFYLWANRFLFIQFGTNKDKETLAIFPKNQVPLNPLENLTVVICKKGLDEIKDFKSKVLSDFRQIGFPINDFGVFESKDGPQVNFAPMAQSEVRAIYISEDGVKGKIWQGYISDGMFRALSLIIMINYWFYTNQSSTVIVDNIGEGLDYDRSANLIKLLLEKHKTHGIQFFLTTNDQFVMNCVELENWQIIKRTGHIVNVYNHINRSDYFKDFKITGLNNFDFFSMNFFDQKI